MRNLTWLDWLAFRLFRWRCDPEHRTDQVRARFFGLMLTGEAVDRIREVPWAILFQEVQTPLYIWRRWGTLFEMHLPAADVAWLREVMRHEVTDERADWRTNHQAIKPPERWTAILERLQAALCGQEEETHGP